MISPNNYFTQQHNKNLKIHSYHTPQIHKNINKFIIKKSNPGNIQNSQNTQVYFYQKNQSDKQRNSSFDVRNHTHQHDQSQSVIYTARSVSQDKKEKNTRVKMVKHLLNSTKKKTLSKERSDSPNQRVNNHDPFQKPLKNITKQLQSLKKVSQLVPNYHSKEAKKYFSHTPKKNSDITLKTTKNSYETQMKKLQKFHQDSFQDYMDFVSANNKTYLISLNFDSLRNMSRIDAWKQIDIKNVKLIESLMLCIFDNITNQKQNSKEIIRQYCFIYFNNFEKSRLEVILIHYYFKMFAFKLKAVFIYQRMVMYFIFILSKMDLIFQDVYCNPIQKTLKAIQQAYTSLLLVVIDVEKSKDSRVGQTFQILKSVSQIEKKLTLIEVQFKSIPVQGVKTLSQIKRQMKPFFVQTEQKNRSHQYLTKMEMILSWKYLRVPPTPFLPELQKEHQYTLVIDLDQTLIYFNQENNILKYRPFMDTFLNSVKQYYELIIFTASSKDYADTLIKQIQNTKKFFQYRLYRQHLTLYNGRMIKDITRIGRDMSKIIIIDNLKVNFSNCPQNGIQISTWTGNKKDKNLLQLLPKLLQIIQNKVTDVRQYLMTQKKTLSHIAQDQDEQQIQ